MSFTLHNLGSENFEFNANVWSWKAALEIIKSLDIVSEGKIRQMGYNATGAKVDGWVDDPHQELMNGYALAKCWLQA